MSWWERIKQALSREAADVKDMAKSGFESLDAELARKERELAASPAERVDMLMEQAAADDERLAALEDKVRKRVSDAEGTDEIGRVVEPERGMTDPAPAEVAAEEPVTEVTDGASAAARPAEESAPEDDPWPIDHARPWVSVRGTTPEDHMPDVFNHAVSVAEQARSALGDDGVAAVADDVDFNPLVLEVREGGGVFYVRAPTLEPGAVRELFVDAIVARLPGRA